MITNSLDVGVISPNSTLRITEVGGNDVSVKVTDPGVSIKDNYNKWYYD